MKFASSTDWLSSGGTYWLLAGEILASAALFAYAGLYLGRVSKRQNDGCLLAIVNILASVCGGGVGFWMAKYPTFILTSLAGALLFPFATTCFIAVRFAKHP